jgi:nucleoside-diphosphate-sugar epimerase
VEKARHILVTGANGFVGTALTRFLIQEGYQVRMTGQTRVKALEAIGAEWFAMADLSEDVDWSPALEGVDAVVHLAAIAHRFDTVSEADRLLYNQVNHLATRSLAKAAARCLTLERLAFVSSIRVHGDPVSFPVDEHSPLRPVTAYDQSKVDAEDAIRELLQNCPLRWAILRPAVVYGQGNKGNMAKLEGLIRKGFPIPVGPKENRRSFLYLGNLLSAIEAFLQHPAPPSGQNWPLADDPPASTERLVLAMGKAMGVQARVVHIPHTLLAASAWCGDLALRLGLPSPWSTDVKNKLLGDFWIDISRVKDGLGWYPPFTLEQGLFQTFQAPKR